MYFIYETKIEIPVIANEYDKSIFYFVKQKALFVFIIKNKLNVREKKGTMRVTVIAW